MKVAIIYSQMFDCDGKEQRVGGIETYLINLGNLCSSIGWQPIIYQRANNRFERMINNIRVIGLPIKNKSFKKIKLELYRTVIKEIDLDRDILIFGGDHHSVPTDYARSITIQHGILWDLPLEYLTRKKIFYSKLSGLLYRLRLAYQYSKIFDNCPNRVCVDYNFLNWYRTISTNKQKGKIWVVPNCAPNIATEEQIHKRDFNDRDIRIIFARRLTIYRGTRLMAFAIKKILQQYDNVSITIAGEGPDENYLKTEFQDIARVSFIKYLPEQSLNIHLAHDIAVIPSIASEGTSFSVAEALSAGCAIVATCIGGITNMIINNYNGILIMPNENALLDAIKQLIENKYLRKKLSINAYETAKASFNIEEWKEKWRMILYEVAGTRS